MTSTDLHIKYKMETGEYFQWKTKSEPSDHSGTGYNSEKGYTRNYAKWLEEKFLEEKRDTEKNIQDLNNRIQELEKQITK
jgi:hypothetical protein